MKALCGTSLATFAVAFSIAAATARADAPETVTAAVDAEAGVVRVKAGSAVFTELRYKGGAKPVLFPLNGPGGVSMVRQWPLAEAAPGEAKDHPHHQSLWLTHGLVNGVDFWAEKPGTTGKVVVQSEPEVTVTDNTAVIKTKESWQKPDGSPVCSSVTVIRCGLDGADRFIDYSLTWRADAGKLTLGDTKEGTMAIRTRPELNLKGEGAKGSAVNSEGVKDTDIWAKKAKWVDYWAPVDGKVLGVACFDHPSNLRHPTTWHARDYGLIAANPFGIHDFTKAPKGAGDVVIEEGKSLTLRYRWLFHTGDAANAKIAERWAAWAK